MNYPILCCDERYKIGLIATRSLKQIELNLQSLTWFFKIGLGLDKFNPGLFNCRPTHCIFVNVSFCWIVKQSTIRPTPIYN